MYCNSVCGEWGASANGCSQEDADVFCQIVTSNRASTALSFELGETVSGPGFCCPSQAEARECTFTGIRDSGEVEVWVSDDLLLNHGVGKNDTTISGVVCV
jgi:hypothetical protein